MTDSPAFGEVADGDDQLGWSWDELTGGVREEATDDEVDLMVLFAGVPDDLIEEHRRQLHELLGN